MARAGPCRSGGGEQVVTLEEAAQRVGVSPATLRRWARTGLIPQYDGDWTSSAIGTARVVARMRDRGHSLAEIREATDEGRLAFGFLEEVSDLEPRVRADGLLRAGGPVVVLYSGGRDSTCLLDLAARIAGPPQVTALHLNYGLRDAAGDDEQHCREVCEQFGVAIEVRRPERPEAGNLQAWARDQRYSAAVRVALPREAEVAAGHTATDQVETILYRLASSPSRRALLGMRARDGLLIRPLLAYTRAEITAHCRARGLGWREDESNASSSFARNRIRAELVPALEAAHPAAQANVLALAEILRQEGAVLDELVDGILQGRPEISLARLRDLPPALRRLVVQRLADAAAGEPAAGVGRRADEVAALSDAGVASLDLPHGVRATATRGVVRFRSRRPP